MAEVTVDHGWIARGWMMPFNGMVQKGMMEMGRGGACVPARVALQGRIHHSSPRTMHVFLVWKRRCADVRAGTQAPPLPFQHISPFRKGENKNFGACGVSAKVKTKNLRLAELPQMAKQGIWRLRSFRKWRNKKFGACGASANGKTENSALAELPQVFRKRK